MISGREASFLLEIAGLTRRQARQVLAAGLAGEPRRGGSTHWYDEDLVVALTARPFADEAMVDGACPRGVFFARRATGAAATWAKQAEVLSPGWPLSPWTHVWLNIRISETGAFPFVGTSCGFVTFGADLVAARPQNDTTVSFALVEPGPWFTAVVGHRIHAGRGRPWVIRGWQPFAATDRPPGRTLRPHVQAWSGRVEHPGGVGGPDLV